TEMDGVTAGFGNVAHRFSRYRKEGRRDGADFTGRGMISTQFVRTPAGWRISVMAWDDERPGLILPETALEAARTAGPAPAWDGRPQWPAGPGDENVGVVGATGEVGRVPGGPQPGPPEQQ